MALYIPHSIFRLARLLYVRPETFGPYYISYRNGSDDVSCEIAGIWTKELAGLDYFVRQHADIVQEFLGVCIWNYTKQRASIVTGKTRTLTDTLKQNTDTNASRKS